MEFQEFFQPIDMDSIDIWTGSRQPFFIDSNSIVLGKFDSGINKMVL